MSTISVNRFVSITFDDGLIKGAQRTAAIFDAFVLKATFYVVTGWVGPREIPWIRDRWNWGLDHGTWHDWIDISQRGHDIGSHTVTHLNASGKLSRYVTGLLGWELRYSFETLRRQLGKRPSSISMPWNSPAKRARDELRLYQACRLGSEKFRTNSLDNLNWHALDSWAPDSKL